MADWTPTEIAVVMGGCAALISAIGTNVVQLVVAFRTHKAVEVVAASVNGMLKSRDIASVARGNLEGRQDLRTEQAEREVTKKEAVRQDAEADAESAAKVRAIEAGANGTSPSPLSQKT